MEKKTLPLSAKGKIGIPLTHRNRDQKLGSHELVVDKTFSEDIFSHLHLYQQLHPTSQV